MCPLWQHLCVFDDKFAKVQLLGHSGDITVLTRPLCVRGLQVVHEAYTRFTEESLMQSVCEKPSEGTEVTIKVSGGSQRGQEG